MHSGHGRSFRVAEIITGAGLPDPISVGEGGTVVTVGTFDGVHRGHRAVIGELLERANRYSRESVLVTFEPHPLAVLRPELAPPRLTTFEEKRDLLSETGLDYVVFLPFTRDLASLTAREFVEEILIERLGLKHLVIGFDHRLGRGRSGGAEELQALGAELGFETDVIGPVSLGDGPVSSTRIREALGEGHVREAAVDLGRRYSFRGRVIEGDGRGRELGFPTANIQLEDQMKSMPLDGVYAVEARVRGEVWDGLLHLGPRPTFPGASRSVELHILDFDLGIYGEAVEVSFIERIRPIRAYQSVDALVAAMHEDLARARELFARESGACE